MENQQLFENDLCSNEVAKAIKQQQQQITSILESINSQFMDDTQKITQEEVYAALKYCNKNFTTTVYLDKKDTFYAHSIVISKDALNKFHIMFKPNIKTPKQIEKIHETEFVKRGNSKIIKTSGAEIVIDDNNTISGLPIITCTAIFVHKEYKPTVGKTLINLQNVLVNDKNFSYINYKNKKDIVRHMYTMPYLGDDLADLINLKKPQSTDDTVTIIKQLFKKFMDSNKDNKYTIGDIKLANAVWNGKDANFIDGNNREAFTFTTQKYHQGELDKLFKKHKNKPIPEEIILSQQIFGLTLLFYQLIEQKTFTTGTHCSDQPRIYLQLNELNPFAKLLQQAYDEKLSLTDLELTTNQLDTLKPKKNPECSIINNMDSATIVNKQPLSTPKFGNHPNKAVELIEGCSV